MYSSTEKKLQMGDPGRLNKHVTAWSGEGLGKYEVKQYMIFR